MVLLAAGLLPWLAACGYTPGPNSLPEPTPAASMPPAQAASGPQPELQPTMEAVTLDRLAEILAEPARPRPQTDGGASFTPAPEVEPFPVPGPGEHDPSRYYRSGFACTGSMRPAIDCGDQGVFQKPPFQEPLLVGDVISFSVEEGCNRYRNHSISKAHRIVSVREEDGTYFYTTKGDSALNPDACEVVIEHVDGKLVELEKGARPQDVRDVSEYDYARERVRWLQDQYDVKRRAFDRRLADYTDQGEEYRRLEAHYQDGGAVDYDEIVATHRELEEERLALNGLMEDINDLGDEINVAIAELDRVYRDLFIR